MPKNYDSDLVIEIKDIVKDIDNIDHILKLKYEKNIMEIELYKQILDNANKNLFIIAKNLK